MIHNDIFTTNRKKKPNLKFVHYTLYNTTLYNTTLYNTTLYNITLYNGPLVQSV